MRERPSGLQALNLGHFCNSHACVNVLGSSKEPWGPFPRALSGQGCCSGGFHCCVGFLWCFLWVCSLTCPVPPSCSEQHFWEPLVLGGLSGPWEGSAQPLGSQDSPAEVPSVLGTAQGTAPGGGSAWRALESWEKVPVFREDTDPLSKGVPVAGITFPSASWV